MGLSFKNWDNPSEWDFTGDVGVAEDFRDWITGTDPSGKSKSELDSFKHQFGGVADKPWWEPKPGAFQTGREAQMRQGYAEGREAAALRQAPLAQAAQIALANQNQGRQAQMALLGDLQAQAEGRTVGPTQANLIAQMQRDQGLKAAMGTMAANRGVPGAVGAAQQMAAEAGIAAGGQATQIRSADQARAQQMLMDLSAQGRTQDIGLATSQAGLTQQADLANQQSQLQQQKMNDQMVAFYEQMGFNSEQAQAQAMRAQEQMRAEQVIAQMNAHAGLLSAQKQADAQKKAGLLGLLASLGVGVAVAASDKNLKKDIKAESKELDALMKNLKPYSYEYKDDKWGKDRRFGIMAQDLEKSNKGKDLVINTQHGKMVDINKGISAALAGLARLNERLEKVEGK